MVKIMENPIKMDDLGGFSHIFGNTHILFHLLKETKSVTVRKKPMLAQTQHEPRNVRTPSWLVGVQGW